MRRRFVSTPLEWLVVSLVALTLGVHRGLSFGPSRSNHEVYVVPGIHLADPSLLARDWWTTQTFHPHVIFTYLVAALTDLGILAWGLALVNIALFAAGVLIVRLWIRAFAERHDLLAWLLFLGLYVGVTGSKSIGWSYLFSPGLQPSAIASVAFLGGMFLYCRRMYLPAGLVLLMGGVCHVNFLILQIGVFALAAMAQGRRDLPTRLVNVVGPSLVGLAWFVPHLVEIALDSHSAAAGRVFLTELFPYHYRPLSNPVAITTFSAWLVLGVVSIFVFDLRQPIRRATALALFLLSGFVGFTVLVSALWPGSFVTRLFPWRLAPFAVLLAQMVFVPAVVTGWSGPPALRRRVWVPWRASVFAACLIVLWLCYPDFSKRLVVGAFLTAVAAGWAGHTVTRASRWREACISPRGIALATSVAALALVVGPWTTVKREHFNLVVAAGPPDKNELYDWVRSTPRDSLFLVPPEFDDFRVMTRRAVVVDLTANPVVPSELMQWRRRLFTVSDVGPPLTSESVQAGYHRMSGTRLRELRGEFGFTHTIFATSDPLAGRIAAQDADREANQWPRVAFRNDTFIVLEMAAPP